jgi:hypothetical protein
MAKLSFGWRKTIVEWANLIWMNEYIYIYICLVFWNYFHSIPISGATQFDSTPLSLTLLFYIRKGSTGCEQRWTSNQGQVISFRIWWVATNLSLYIKRTLRNVTQCLLLVWILWQALIWLRAWCSGRLRLSLSLVLPDDTNISWVLRKNFAL